MNEMELIMIIPLIMIILMIMMILLIMMILQLVNQSVTVSHLAKKSISQFLALSLENAAATEVDRPCVTIWHASICFTR